MSQTNGKVSAHKLSVRSRDPGNISTGANTIVELDGKPLKLVTFLKIECKPKGLVKVVLEMYCEVEADVNTELQQDAINPDEEIKIGDAVYVLSRYETIGVPVKK